MRVLGKWVLQLIAAHCLYRKHRVDQYLSIMRGDRLKAARHGYFAGMEQKTINVRRNRLRDAIKSLAGSHR